MNLNKFFEKEIKRGILSKRLPPNALGKKVYNDGSYTRIKKETTIDLLVLFCEVGYSPFVKNRLDSEIKFHLEVKLIRPWWAITEGII